FSRPPRLEAKATRSPSGDHTGPNDSPAPKVNRDEIVRSTSMSHKSVEVGDEILLTTMFFPSGDKASSSKRPAASGSFFVNRPWRSYTFRSVLAAAGPRWMSVPFMDAFTNGDPV